MVNVGESEYRALEPGDKALLQAAAVTGGVPLETVDRGKTMELYAQGLVYFTVPIAPNDHVTIPPLEVCDGLFLCHSCCALYAMGGGVSQSQTTPTTPHIHKTLTKPTQTGVCIK